MDRPQSDAREVRPRGIRRVIIVIGILAAALLLVVLFYGPHAVVVHQPDAVHLSASLNSSVINENQTVKVTLSDTNYLPFQNAPSGTTGWKTLQVSAGPCGGLYPTGIALYEGHYTLGNVSSAEPLQFYAPGFYSCLPIGVNNLAPLQTATRYVNLDGYWTAGETSHPGGGVSEGILHPFLPGKYTVIAADGWGHSKILYFEVRGIALQGFSLCPSDCGYPSPYLNGLIYFDGQSPPKSLELFVNGTAEGAQNYSGGLTNFVMLYKGGFQTPQVVSGDAYVLRFVATFQDGSIATATTLVVAD